MEIINVLVYSVSHAIFRFRIFFHFFLHNPGSLPSAFIVIQSYLPDVLRASEPYKVCVCVCYPPLTCLSCPVLSVTSLSSTDCAFCARPFVRMGKTISELESLDNKKQRKLIHRLRAPILLRLKDEYVYCLTLIRRPK